MDFNDTPEESSFRAEARAFLEAHVSLRRKTAILNESESDAISVQRAKDWQRVKAEHGWACLTYPAEYGGRDATPIQSIIWSEEEAQFDVPTGVLDIGLGMCGPTLIKWASEEIKQARLPRLVTGEEVWCQLFSEPGAGSDLANVRTRCEREGDEWVVNGQKVWTSGALYSDWGILLARSDPKAVKHKGLTYFIVDMKSKGIEVRPIKQINGKSSFNEVYLSDVRIPDSQRIGREGGGWEVALTTLMNERVTVGDAYGADVAELLELAHKVQLEGKPAIKDRAIRASIAKWYCESAGLRNTQYRTISALSRGEIPGPENSIAKIVSARKMQGIGSFAIDLMDMGGIVSVQYENDEFDSAAFQSTFLTAPGIRIAGGTDEILRNIIAERVLGLPADVRVDKGIPFNEVKQGA